MAGGRTSRVPRVKPVALWAGVAALLGLGFLTTLIDFGGLATREVARANTERQRFLVNTATGEVLLDAKSNAESEHKFDVGTEDAAPTPPPPEHEPAADAPATNTPTETPPATSETAPTSEAEPLPDDAPALRTTPLIATIDATPIHSNESLVPAPAREISEMVDGISLPKRGANDLTPAKLYARPFARKPDQVLISFVVMDAGIDSQSIGLLMALPPMVSVAYSPYARPSQSYSEHLRALGHEVWTMLPTMDSRYPAADPGPMGIITGMPQEENARRTRQVLGAIAGSVGVVLPPDETIVAQKDALSPSLGEVSSRGLLLLSTHPSRNIDQITPNAGLAEIIRRADLILDPAPDESKIRSKLAGIIPAAQEKGEYVVVLSARPQSLKILGEWLKETPLAEPLTLAPLSAIYQPKEAPEAKAEEAEAGGHGGEKKEKPKPKPTEKKQKPLPQDKYLKPAAEASGGHGGGGGH